MISISDNNDNTSAKAWGLTVLACLLLALLLIFIRWQNTILPHPIDTDDGGVEVNFGNSDQGMGTIPPMIPSDPAPDIQKNTTIPPPAAQAQPDEPTARDVVDNKDADAPVIRTSPKPKKQEPVKKNKAVSKEIDKSAASATDKKTKAAQPSVTKTEPKPETPKAVYKGGNGKGGNGADSYNGINNQGIAGGKGDQGKMGGNPNSDSYTGTGKGTGGSGSGYGNSGVQVVSGLSGRRFAGFPSFEDNFNENARVSVDISVDADGHVTSVDINPRGTTTTNSNIRSIALRRARQLKFNKGTADTQTGTVSFNFRLKG